MRIRPRLTFLYSLTVAMAAFAGEPATAESLGPISEETPPAACDPGSFINSIQCTGRYCDNIRITCGRFSNAILGGDTWMDWVSEEQGLRHCPANNLLAGFACRGSYCDNISLLCVEATNLNVISCVDETRRVSEERGGLLSFSEYSDKAGQMIFATGMKCFGRYCDDKTFRVCEVTGK
jgi:hypothetical protein